MNKYNYRAIDNQGRAVRGSISAANEKDLAQQLSERGMELIEAKSMETKKKKAAFKAKIKTRDMVQLFVHLEQLQKAGVPLMDGLSDIRDTTESAKLRDIMTEVYRDVSEGNSLSEAMSNHPSVFTNIFISLIGAGEETGNLSNSFTQLIHHLKWTDAMDSKVKQATKYPKILGVVMFGVVTLMMAYVVPQVLGFLESMDQELGMITTSLIATSDFFVANGLYVGIGIVVFIASIKIGRAVSTGFRYQTDKLALNMPVMGILIRKISLSRFAQTFGVLFSSGLEILRCLESAQKTAGNLVMQEALERVREQVKEGNPISTALNNSGEFPSLVVRMVKIGEESGNLTGVLEQVAEFYDKDVNEAVDSMIQMIEPMMTVILGGIMLWIAAAVFGPIYNSFSNMGI